MSTPRARRGGPAATAPTARGAKPTTPRPFPRQQQHTNHVKRRQQAEGREGRRDKANNNDEDEVVVAEAFAVAVDVAPSAPELPHDEFVAMQRVPMGQAAGVSPVLGIPEPDLPSKPAAAQGGEVNEDNAALTALRQAIKTNKLESVCRLLQEGGDLACLPPPVLHEACALGSIPLAEVLVKHGADVHGVESKHLNTPLHVACSKGHAPLVRWLLDSEGAQLNRTNRFHQSPLHVACEHHRVEVAELVALRDHRRVQSTWFAMWLRWVKMGVVARTKAQSRLFAAVGRTLVKETVEDLLRGPHPAFDLHQQQLVHKAHVVYAHRTALHVACSAGRLDAVETLVQFGADPEAVARDDWYTPLHCACQRNQLAVAKWLVGQARVNPVARSVKGKTPLQVALHMQAWPVVEFLESFDVVVTEMSQPERDGALCRACCRGSVPLVRKLLMAGAQFDLELTHHEHPYRATPLGFALHHGHNGVVDLLRTWRRAYGDHHPA